MKYGKISKKRCYKNLLLNQVIFHAVEQLKLFQTEEILQESLVTNSTSATQSMIYQQSQSTIPVETSMITTATTTKVYDEKIETPEILASIPVSQTSSQGSSEIYNDLTEATQHAETSTLSGLVDHEESPEINEEMAEMNYESPATPETNQELPEPVQETQESNQKLPEKSEEFLQHDDVSQQQSTQKLWMARKRKNRPLIALWTKFMKS